MTRFACAALLAIALPSCAYFKPQPPPKATTVLSDWHDDGGPGEVSVEIDLGRQLAIYKRGDRPIGWSFVSTGKEGHSTPPGNYTITEKMELKESNRYGWIADAAGNVTNGDARPTTPVPEGEFYHPAPMHYWMRITNYGVGLHAGEIPLPGEAASHGCIRLPKDFVPELYAVAKVGTPVKVVRGKRPPPEQIGLVDL
ncbi:L,D-transpeptidase [Haloferula sp. BvORR071]|uniref:L,D-transpeptidase n=1 Tax=Haloferula sp. BvORR071 TaxID=1396141 RepID=UPI0006973A08|nr:L,D-transpeptidase [Haloferula sp. BvORR071]